MSDFNNEEQFGNGGSDDRRTIYVLHNDQNSQNNGSGEIDFANVFGNMKKKKKIFVRVIALFVLIGFAISLIMYQGSKTILGANAVITVKSDIVDLPTDMKSSFVLQNALDKSGLASKISATSLAKSITVERCLTEETLKRLEILSDGQFEVADIIETAMAVKLEYTNRYIVTLNNDFSDEGGKNSFSITEREAYELLDNIVEAYRDYLNDSYADQKLPENVIQNANFESLDYLDSVDKMNEALQRLISYCNSKSEYYSYFRSAKDGLSFSDISRTASALKDATIDSISAYVYSNSLSKDVEAMLSNYRFTIRNLDVEIAQVNNNIVFGENSIAEYKNKSTSVLIPESELSQDVKSITDYYNALVIKQIQLYERKAELERQREELVARVEHYENKSTTVDKETEKEIGEIKAKIEELYGLVADRSMELFRSDVYSRRYFDSIVVSEVEKDSSMIKNSLIGLVAGAVIALMIWFIDGFIVEMKAKRKNEKGGNQ